MNRCIALCAALALAGCNVTQSEVTAGLDIGAAIAGPTLAQLSGGSIAAACDIVNQAEIYFDGTPVAPANLTIGSAAEAAADAICGSKTGSAATLITRLEGYWFKIQNATKTAP